jgi:sialidase-1
MRAQWRAVTIKPSAAVALSGLVLAASVIRGQTGPQRLPREAERLLCGGPEDSLRGSALDEVETRSGARHIPLYDEQVLFARAEGGYFCFRIPAIVEATDGTLLAFAEGRIADCGDDGDIDLVLKRSSDGGKTWTPLQVVLEGGGDTRGNPVPIVDERTGRVVLMTTYNPGPNARDRRPFVQHSDDHGAKWSSPRDLSAELKPAEWNRWYATGPGHGIQLRRGPHAGRLIVPANHVTDDGVNPPVYGGHLLYSDDGGDTWQRGAVDRHGDGRVRPGEMTAVEMVDGSIYASAREENGTDPGNRAFAVSRDGGATFHKPFETVPGLVTPIVQGSTLRLRAEDEGDAARRVPCGEWSAPGCGANRILFSGPAHPVVREVMAVRSSYDEGRSWDTWQEGKVIHWGPSAYSDMVRLGVGEVGLVYEAGQAIPYESIRFNEAFLATPNGVPPGLPGAPAPGPTTPDSSPYRNDGYVRGGAHLGPGQFGAAIVLDRVDDRVEVPFSESLDLGAGDFTWSAWIRDGERRGGHAIVWAYRMGSAPVPQVWLRAEPASNRIRALLGAESGTVSISSAGAYNDGAWHHVVLQRADGRFVLRVDGAEVASAAAPRGSVTAGKEFTIDGIHVGQRLDGADRFLGMIDDVRIYRRALSPEELDLVRERAAPIGGRLVLWLEFETLDPQ